MKHESKDSCVNDIKHDGHETQNVVYRVVKLLNGQRHTN